MRTAKLDDSVLTHGGENVVTNPELGKSSTPKQTLKSEGEFESIRLTLALSPTLITTESGETLRIGPD